MTYEKNTMTRFILANVHINDTFLTPHSLQKFGNNISISVLLASTSKFVICITCAQNT